MGNKLEFTVEDMIKFGEDQLKKEELSNELIQFHKFTIDMLNFELGIDMAAKSSIVSKTNLMSKSIEGAKILAVAAGGMRQYARTTAYELGMKKLHPIKKVIFKYVKLYDKKSMEWYYYKSGLRYMAGIGWR